MGDGVRSVEDDPDDLQPAENRAADFDRRESVESPQLSQEVAVGAEHVARRSADALSAGDVPIDVRIGVPRHESRHIELGVPHIGVELSGGLVVILGDRVPYGAEQERQGCQALLAVHDQIGRQSRAQALDQRDDADEVEVPMIALAGFDDILPDAFPMPRRPDVLPLVRRSLEVGVSGQQAVYRRRVGIGAEASHVGSLRCGV